MVLKQNKEKTDEKTPDSVNTPCCQMGMFGYMGFEKIGEKKAQCGSNSATDSYNKY